MNNPFKNIDLQAPVSRSNECKSERADYIRKFTEKLNLGRIGTKYKPLTPKRVAIELGHLKKIQDLHYFWKECERAKSFGACFFSSLKVK